MSSTIIHRLPRINVQWTATPRPKPKQRIKGPLARARQKCSLMKLTWDQVCEIRRLHECAGMNDGAIFRHCIALGWPVKQKGCITNITTYRNRLLR